jgi:hypothetical protein
MAFPVLAGPLWGPAGRCAFHGGSLFQRWEIRSSGKGVRHGEGDATTEGFRRSTVVSAG